MSTPTWTAGDPRTRVADDEDLVGHLAWPNVESQDASVVRARALQDLERLIRLGLPYRVDAGVRRFDPHEVFFFMRWAHHRLGDPLWLEYLRGTRRVPAEYAPGGPERFRFQFLLERELNVEARRPASLFRTQLPCPAGDGAQRALETVPIDQEGVHFASDGALLDVRFRVPMESPRTVRFAVNIALTVGWRGCVVDPARVEPSRAPEPEDQPFLDASEDPIRVTDRIQRLAADLADGAGTPWDAVRAFWRFLFTSLVIGRIHPHALDADDPLWSTVQAGRTDCYYGAALLAALCRARGIPARLVLGHFLYAGCPTNHCWVEVLVRPYGWVSCDLWSWILADGDLESEWSEAFFGRVDPRLVLERFPRTRLIMEPKAPGPAYALQRAHHPGAVDIIVRDLARNELVYRDRVSCLRSSLPDGVRGSAATRST